MDQSQSRSAPDIGTNDLLKDTAEQVTKDITKLVYEIERHDIKCTVSSIIITHKGELDLKVHQVNKELSSRFKTKFVYNQNITLNHLNNGGLHLNKRRDGALALNFINHIRDWDKKVTVSMNEKNFVQKDCAGTEPSKSSLIEHLRDCGILQKMLV